jgi:hypothetical protein
MFRHCIACKVVQEGSCSWSFCVECKHTGIQIMPLLMLVTDVEDLCIKLD